MRRESQKEREQRHLYAFRQIYSDFPSGKIQHTDNPDFLVKQREAILGIELTGLYWPKIKGKQEPKKVFETQDRILRRCREIAEEAGVPPVYAQVHFRWDNISYDIETTAEKIIARIRPIVEGFGTEGKYDSDPYPVEGIIRIRVRSCRYKGLWWCDSHRWERVFASTLMVDPIVEIQERVDEKNKRYNEYLSRCQRCWLVIATDGLYYPEAFHLTERTLNHGFSCRFDRLLFMNTIDREVHELKAQN